MKQRAPRCYIHERVVLSSGFLLSTSTMKCRSRLSLLPPLLVQSFFWVPAWAQGAKIFQWQFTNNVRCGHLVQVECADPVDRPSRRTYRPASPSTSLSSRTTLARITWASVSVAARRREGCGVRPRGRNSIIAPPVPAAMHHADYRRHRAVLHARVPHRWDAHRAAHRRQRQRPQLDRRPAARFVQPHPPPPSTIPQSP